MNHETASGLLLDRAWGELPPERARELEAHLAACAACRAEAARIEATRGIMRRLGSEPEPAGEAILLAAARQAAERARPRRFPWLVASLATAAAVTVVVGGVTMKLTGGRPSDRAEERYAARPPEVAPAAAAVPAEPAAPAAARPEERQADAAPAAAPTPPALPARKAAPVQDRIAAGERRAEPSASAALPVPRAASRAAQAPAASPAGDAGEALLRELRASREAGELNEAHRRPDPCPGGDTARLAWFDGWGVARRYSRSGPAPGGGDATRDHYYDAAGRARLVLIDGGGPDGRYRRRILLGEDGRRLGEDPPGAAPWPEADLTLRDGAAAFWAPQRCGR